MKKTFKDPFGRTIINKSKLDFCKDTEYWKNSYDCELCGITHKFDEMSTCERCLRFVCDDCSEAVCNRENNQYKGWDFLCNDCIKELTEEKKKERARRKQIMHGLHNTGKLKRKHV